MFRADYSIEAYSDSVLWIVIIAFIFAFILAVAVGANDVANSYGTSVGSGVLTLQQVYFIGAITETSGALFLGYRVTDTLRKSIIDITLYDGREVELMLGCIAALLGTAGWIFVATFWNLPISSTQSMVSSTVGFSIVRHGFNGIRWSEMVKILSSWFISPILSGTITLIGFALVHFLIFKAKKPFEAGLIAMPIIYFYTTLINFLMAFSSESDLPFMRRFPFWGSAIIAIFCSILVALFVHYWGVPRVKQKVTDQYAAPDAQGDVSEEDKQAVEGKKVERIFSFLQILSALFASFTHGGNDVSNVIGPLICTWLLYTEGSINIKEETPIFLLIYGGIGISLGLWMLGGRIIETVGTRLSKITAPNGFLIEMGAAQTVLIASVLGLPVSTTHCIVGSIVFIGFVNGRIGESITKEGEEDPVNWKLFGAIFLSWAITMPASAILSAGSMYILGNIFLNE